VPRASLASRGIGVLKEAIGALGGSAAFRSLAMRLVRRMNRDTFRRLGRHPAVAAVYVKGSFVRGPFRPLASDVDLVLVLRDAALGEPVEALRRLFAELRIVRRHNLSVRDWWQHLLLESELPLVRCHWELFGADEWRDASGAAPFGSAAPSDLRRLVIAQWYQQCLWSGSAVQRFLDPGAEFHDFGAGVRKSGFFASRLRLFADQGSARLPPEELFELRRRHAREFDARHRARSRAARAPLAALVAMVRDLETNARRLGGVDPGTSGETRVVSERTLHVLLPEGLADAELAERLLELRERREICRPLTFLVPASARALWPLACAAERSAPLDVAPPGEERVAFRQELLLFEALFLPSSLRLALGFVDSTERLRRVFWALARALLLYSHHRYDDTRAGIAAAWLQLRAEEQPLPPAFWLLLEGGTEANERELFSVATALAARLDEALARFGGPARRAEELAVG
jgi:predicted nucleotidyltransferase